MAQPSFKERLRRAQEEGAMKAQRQLSMRYGDVATDYPEKESPGSEHTRFEVVEREREIAESSEIAFEKHTNVIEKSKSQDAILDLAPTRWYQNITVTQNKPVNRSHLQAMRRIREMIQLYKNQVEQGKDIESVADEIRQRIHVMEFFDFVSGPLLKSSKVLETGGLIDIFKHESNGFPWDVSADALNLYRKWMSGNLGCDLLAGIKAEKTRSSSGRLGLKYTQDPSYQLKRTSNYHGEVHFTNGKWWPLQICALRDGAHGEIEAGIHGCKGEGVYSIVVSDGGYEDQDTGDVLQYCGTKGSEKGASRATKLMLESESLKYPIRVLRSAALPLTNQYRPSRGLRYDGLYAVDKHEVLDKDTVMYRFTLKRQPGQGPIRNQSPGSRPTQEELGSLSKIRDLLGLN